MADHGLCCDKRAEMARSPASYVNILPAYDAADNFEGFELFLHPSSGGAYSFPITHCPWCGVELNLGAEGVDDACADCGAPQEVHGGESYEEVCPQFRSSHE